MATAQQLWQALTDAGCTAATVVIEHPDVTAEGVNLWNDDGPLPCTTIWEPGPCWRWSINGQEHTAHADEPVEAVSTAILASIR